MHSIITINGVRVAVRILVLLLASLFMVSCDNDVTLEQETLKTEQRVPETLQEEILRQRKQEKIAGDFFGFNPLRQPESSSSSDSS